MLYLIYEILYLLFYITIWNLQILKNLQFSDVVIVVSRGGVSDFSVSVRFVGVIDKGDGSGHNSS